jgi:hypothetical protein
LLSHPYAPREKSSPPASHPLPSRQRQTMGIGLRRAALTLSDPHETMFFSRTEVLVKNKL